MQTPQKFTTETIFHKNDGITENNKNTTIYSKTIKARQHKKQHNLKTIEYWPH